MITLCMIPAGSGRSAEIFWQSIEKMNSVAAFQDHLDRFADCPFATLAKRRIEALKK